MDDVSFEEDKTLTPAPVVTRKGSSFARFIISIGLAKTEKDAEYILLGIAVVAIVLAVIIYFVGNPSKPAPTTATNPQPAATQ